MEKIRKANEVARRYLTEHPEAAVSADAAATAVVEDGLRCRIDGSMNPETPAGGGPLVNGMPHVDRVSHRFVDVSGLRMHVAESGPADGDPVMLVHGWPQHWYEWRDLIPVLAANGYRVICPDLRGHGWSDAPERGYDKEQFADDLIGLLDALAIDRVKLVGHDWGGWTGFLLCLKAPERVERYLAMNCAHPFQKFDATVVSYLPHTWYTVPIEIPLVNRWALSSGRYPKLMLRMGLVNRAALSDADYEVFAERYRDLARVRASARLYSTFTFRELPEILRGRYRDARLRVPTLMLHGTRDIFVPKRLMRGLKEHADDVRIEWVDDAAHFIAEDKPELVAKRALEFFGESAERHRAAA